MTFTKTGQLLEALKVEHATALAKVKELEAKENDLNTIKGQLDSDKAQMESTINTLKTDFAAQVASLEEKIAGLTKEKTEVIASAKVEVEQAKEIKKEELTQKVFEGVAIKIAALGMTEDKLPPVSTETVNSRFSINRFNQ